MNKEMPPILLEGTGADEISSPERYAKNKFWEFKYVDYVKSKNIKRCYFIFHYNPEKNKFLKKLKVVFNFHSGSTITKVFVYKNALIAISPLGGPAAAKLMEELSIFGITEFIAVGSAGCLSPENRDKFLLVEKAIRDEGTSYHYLKPSTYVETDETLTKEVELFLKEREFGFVKGITWTGDALYRETEQKTKMAKSFGAVSAEMECASWCAVAKYRGFKFAQLIYFSDIIAQGEWTRVLKYKKTGNDAKRYMMSLLVKEMIDEYSNKNNAN